MRCKPQICFCETIIGGAISGSAKIKFRLDNFYERRNLGFVKREWPFFHVAKNTRLNILLSVWILTLGISANCFGDEISDLSARAKNAGINGDYNLAISYLDKMIQLGDIDAYSARGFMYFQKKEYSKALSDYSQQVLLNPNSSVFESMGDVYVEMGDSAKAVESYTESINQNPKKASVYVSRAWEYLKLNSIDSALIDCNMTILLLSDDANKRPVLLESAYGMRGSIFSRRGKYDRAYDDYSSAIGINATNSITYNLRGWMAVCLGEYGKSIIDFETALQLNPKDDLAYRRLAWVMATCPVAKYRNGQKALENAKKAYDLTAWKDLLNLTTIAAAYAEIGDFEQAVTWEQKAENEGLKNQDLKDSQARLELYKQKKPFRLAMPKAN